MYLFWSFVDTRVAEARSSILIETMTMVKSYLDQVNIPREACPLLWWKQNHATYLFLAKKYLATSVPSERLFSKAGELISTEGIDLNQRMLTLCCF